MKSYYWFWLIGVICSCSGKKAQKILVPTLNDGFYAEALLQIDAKIRKDPKNPHLVEQKIFYCERLSWPVGCIDGLDQYKSYHGMSNQLADQYMAFYLANNHMQSIVELISKWDRDYNLSERFRKPLIKSLVITGDYPQAIFQMNALLEEKSQQSQVLGFVSDQYLEMSDTLMAAYYLGRLSKLDSTHPLMLNYGKILVNLGYLDKGFEKLDHYYQLHSKESSLTLELASFYEDNLATQKARNMLKPIAKQDTIGFYLSTLYRRDLQWDSALMYLDTVLAKDTKNLRAWKKKGAIYEERGWLSTSLSMFERALTLDSMDTSLHKRMSLIRRKIAYLQRQKFEDSRVPLLEIESKKIKIDE